jgi:hypothetical protein
MMRQAESRSVDPHYTGPENPEGSRADGLPGSWVTLLLPADLCLHKAFYNLLCPQRPCHLMCGLDAATWQHSSEVVSADCHYRCNTTSCLFLRNACNPDLW